jgi:hypothetical protein
VLPVSTDGRWEAGTIGYGYRRAGMPPGSRTGSRPSTVTSSVDGYAANAREVELDDERDKTAVAVPPGASVGLQDDASPEVPDARQGPSRRRPLKHLADLARSRADCKAPLARRGGPWRATSTLDYRSSAHSRLGRRDSPKLRSRSRPPPARHDVRHQSACASERCFGDRRASGSTTGVMGLDQLRGRMPPFSSPARCAAAKRLAVAFTLVDNCLALGIDPELPRASASIRQVVRLATVACRTDSGELGRREAAQHARQ